MYFSFYPLICFRILGHCKYQSRHHLEFEKLYTVIYSVHNLTYGGWTLINFPRYVGLNNACTYSENLSMVTYQVMVILGLIPAVTIIFVTMLSLILLPVILKEMYIKWRMRVLHE